jgi:hypothetical protein
MTEELVEGSVQLAQLYDAELTREPDVVIIFDRDGTFLAVSGGEISPFLIPEKIAIGRSIMEIIQPFSSAAFFLGKVAECCNSKSKVVFRCPIRSKGGEMRHFECECVPCALQRVAVLIRDLERVHSVEDSLVCCSVPMASTTAVLGVKRRCSLDSPLDVQSVRRLRLAVSSSQQPIPDVTGLTRFLTVFSYPLVCEGAHLPFVNVQRYARCLILMNRADCVRVCVCLKRSSWGSYRSVCCAGRSARCCAGGGIVQ